MDGYYNTIVTRPDQDMLERHFARCLDISRFALAEGAKKWRSCFRYDMVHFVGAGPGRGFDHLARKLLLEGADVVIYTGSLVNLSCFWILGAKVRFTIALR